MPDDAGHAPLPVTRADVEAAHDGIRGIVRRTPVVTLTPAELGLAPDLSPVTLKLETLQHSGSFKARGVAWSLQDPDLPKAGVVCASGGNHGAALAWGAAALGIPATVFAFTHTSEAKVRLIERLGGTVRRAADDFDTLMEMVRDHAARTGARIIHAYDQPRTLAGQGTTAREFLDQAEVGTLLIATGGGGLIGGVAAWAEDRIRVVSVEPEGAPSLYRALEAGRPVAAPASGIAADSLGPVSVGRLMFPIAEAFVDDALLVPDDAIRQAQRVLWHHLRIVAEPGGATAFAALLSGAYRPGPGERVGILVCGGNCDPASVV